MIASDADGGHISLSAVPVDVDSGKAARLKKAEMFSTHAPFPRPDVNPIGHARSSVWTLIRGIVAKKSKGLKLQTGSKGQI